MVSTQSEGMTTSTMPLPPLVLVAAAALSGLEPAILFWFGWEEAVAASVRYTKLVFSIFARVYLLDSPWVCMGGLGEENSRQSSV